MHPASGRSPAHTAGACDFAIDPALDAREAHPAWIGAEDRLPHLRAAQERGGCDGLVFGLWRIGGRRRLLHAGADLILSTQDGPQWLRASVSPALAEGSPCRPSLPLGGGAAAARDACALMQALRSAHSAPAFRRVSRMDLLHLRGLQALDAWQAGCGHREVGEAVFGTEAVAGRWHADSELRAQVRHILGRATSFVTGGYLQLAGVRPGSR